MRSLSYSEISLAMSCFAAWDYRYGGRLAGDALEPRRLAPILGDGRAWGAAVAAYHATGSSMAASGALLDSLHADYDTMVAAGFIPPLVTEVERLDRLLAILADYLQRTPPLGDLTRLEGEIDVPLPSRSGRGPSSRYRFRCLIDGYTTNVHGHRWVVEFKFRGQLQDAELVILSRQPRWYAWALRELLRSQGAPDELMGVLVEERLAEAPRAPKLVKGVKEYRGRRVPSTDVRQLTTPELYLAACEDADVEPDRELMISLEARRWQQRVPILFREGELDEAGLELVGAAKLIRDLDSGELPPIRNAKPANCRSCAFKGICQNPSDRLLVDTRFVRVPPKRHRNDEEDRVAA